MKTNSISVLPSGYDRMKYCIKSALPKAMKTAIWLLKITIPVSFGVLLLNFTGILSIVATYLEPGFRYMGLPGESAIVLLTSVFTNIYSVVAIIPTLGIETREATILALMCLISHGFIIETVVQKKTGSSAIRIVIIRLIGSIVAGVFLNFILPLSTDMVDSNMVKEMSGFRETFINWSLDIISISLKIILLVSILFIIQNILEEFGIIKVISKILQPFLRVFGLPESASFSFIIVNTIGLAYGSAVLLEQKDKGILNKKDADLLNHHAAVSHSQIEDPLLFLTIGLQMHWLIWPRLLIAIVMVWVRRLEIKLRMNNV